MLLLSISFTSNHSILQQLFHFIRSIDNRLSVPTCVLILKTSDAGLKVLSDTKSFVAAFKLIMKLLLMVLLLALELSCINTSAVKVTDGEPLEAYAEASTKHFNVHSENASSLNALKETQNTLILICILAKHRNLWNRGMKDMEAQLRERSIHLLAFISWGTQLLGESSRGPPLLCHPILKQELEWYKKASFVNSKNGWFSLSPLACGLNPHFSTLSSKTTAPSTENIEVAPPTCFSDTAATEIYRIPFYLLNFLCLQANTASRRAEEVGFVDAAHFPELPMPDILHGLQVRESCSLVCRFAIMGCISFNSCLFSFFSLNHLMVGHFLMLNVYSSAPSAPFKEDHT